MMGNSSGHLRALQTSSEQTLGVMLRKGFVKFAAEWMNSSDSF